MLRSRYQMYVLSVAGWIRSGVVLFIRYIWLSWDLIFFRTFFRYPLANVEHSCYDELTTIEGRG